MAFWDMNWPALLIILVPQNSLIDDSELHKTCRSMDLKAPICEMFGQVDCASSLSFLHFSFSFGSLTGGKSMR